jgi:hypothetical protein
VPVSYALAKFLQHLVSEVIRRFFFEAKEPSVKMGRFNAGRQGRGRGGRGNGHTSSGGRGEGKSRSNNNKSSSTKKTENINDFVFQPLQLGKQQASNT